MKKPRTSLRTNPLPNDILNIKRFALRECGLNLPDEKTYLIVQRLEALLKATGCSSYGEFYTLLSNDSAGMLRDQVISALTTHETEFFRDQHPFDIFRDHLLPESSRIVSDLEGHDPGQVQFLSVGVSTGQEAYSIAMIIADFVLKNRFRGVDPRRFHILGIDVSQDVIKQANQGRYSEEEIRRGLPVPMRDRFFEPHDGFWEAKPELKGLVAFMKANLLSGYLPLKSFKVVFCRNLLIYFDGPTRKAALERLHQIAEPGGILFLGASETILETAPLFESVRFEKALAYRAL